MNWQSHFRSRLESLRYAGQPKGEAVGTSACPKATKISDGGDIKLVFCLRNYFLHFRRVRQHLAPLDRTSIIESLLNAMLAESVARGRRCSLIPR